jgi:hypothetical protein
MLDEQNADQEDSGDATLLSQEQPEASGQPQADAQVAAGSPETENQPESNDVAVMDKRLRDTQAKVTELAEQLKAAQLSLASSQQQREEPFDEEKFIDQFIGGEEAYAKYRDDPALGVRDLARKMLYHQAKVALDLKEQMAQQIAAVQNGYTARTPEYAEYANDIKEIEDNFDLSAMSADDKVKLAKIMRGKRGGNSVTPPPGPQARRASAPAKRTNAPAGFFESLGLVDGARNDNTLL